MCNNKALREDLSSLQYIPEWFVTPQEMWYEHFDNGDELVTWCNHYKQHKA